MRAIESVAGSWPTVGVYKAWAKAQRLIANLRFRLKTTSRFDSRIRKRIFNKIHHGVAVKPRLALRRFAEAVADATHRLHVVGVYRQLLTQ